MSTTSEPPQRKTRRIIELGPAWISALATLIVALTGVGYLFGRVSAPTQPVAGSRTGGTSLTSNTPDSPATPSPDSPAAVTESQIAFLRPQNGDHVKQCPVIEGSGQIPSNKGLWIIVVPDSTANPKQYWIESPAKMDGPDHWSASDPVSIDSPKSNGVDAYIYAVLLDKKWSDYFAASSAEGNFTAQSLPPTETTAAGPVTVTRVAEPGGQSCHSNNP